ncbi:hypothetical protein [Leucobacter sp. M11]|uniref:hypothetical protein n=1 Tax=Leucobacter sp. M11 TaxID=2993565 RepID=UPI002D807C2D|nr:hypothetical protein [Leucobacter sp. M11]MEB4614513.1 hypothetical protein [Leucobacter sp. M11]
MSLSTGSVNARSLLLAEDGRELDELFSDPELLIDVVEQPGHAAERWRAKREEQPGWSAGVLHLTVNEVLLSDARTADDLWPLWSYLLSMLDEYLRDGVGQFAFPNREIHVVLRDRDGATYFSVGDAEIDVHARSLVPQLLDAAESFFSWVTEIADEDAQDELEFIAEIREELAER